MPKRRRRFVVDERGNKYPFSRGVLVRSLIRAGLSIDDAYLIAEEVASSFVGTITTSELAKKVQRILADRFGKSLAQKYRKLIESKEIVVEEDTGSTSVPFSKGILANSIRSAGLDTSEAFEIAKKVEDFFKSNGEFRVKRSRIRQVVEKLLEKYYGHDTAKRYLLWRKARELKKPVIILISGATGVGKSRLAAELTTIFDINRMASTDSIREVMRRMISKDIVPSIHVSSYEAGKVIYRFAPLPEEAKVIYGFVDQSEKVLSGVKALVDRAVKENVSLIVEGIHLLPGALKEFRDKTHMVQVLLTTLDEDMHKGRFKTREKLSQRTSRKYLKNFKAIRAIQSYIYELAKREAVPIIDNVDFDQTRQKAVEIITDRLLKEVEKC